MSWSYRIVEWADGTGFGLHEVHYDAAGQEISMSKSPCGFSGDTAEEVRAALMTAKIDLMAWPIFREPPDWSGLELRGATGVAMIGG